MIFLLQGLRRKCQHQLANLLDPSVKNIRLVMLVNGLAVFPHFPAGFNNVKCFSENIWNSPHATFSNLIEAVQKRYIRYYFRKIIGLSKSLYRIGKI